MTSTQVAVTQKGIAGMILSDAGRARLQGLVPKGDTLERIASVAALEVRKNPTLAECEPLSILESVGRIMAWGLEVGETAYLVPFGKKCQPMKGYQGLIQLMYDSGHVRGVEPRVVYEGEPFTFAQGLQPRLEHQPLVSAKERGKIVGAYCIIRLPFGHSLFEYFPADEIDAVRQKFSKQWKAGALPAWYAKKFAVTHTAKLLPKSSKFAAIHDAIRREADVELQEVEEIDADVVDTTTGEVLDPRPTRNVARDYGRDEDAPRLTRAAVAEGLDAYEVEDDAA